MPRFLVERLENCKNCRYFRILRGDGADQQDKVEVMYCLLSRQLISLPEGRGLPHRMSSAFWGREDLSKGS